ncbi:MAG: hypothetical protein M8467_21030 [Anaerolineae bacterium]|nr:hypothetical protein [Anaerolineae bacterium]
MPDPTFSRPAVEIKGGVRRAINPPPQCRFFPRCPRGDRYCRDHDHPRLVDRGAGTWEVNGSRAGRVCMGEETMLGSVIRHIVWGRVSLARYEPLLVALVPALPNGPCMLAFAGPLDQARRGGFGGTAAGNARYRGRRRRGSPWTCGWSSLKLERTKAGW